MVLEIRPGSGRSQPPQTQLPGCHVLASQVGEASSSPFFLPRLFLFRLSMFEHIQQWSLSDAVREFVVAGHEVVVEAGAGVNASDQTCRSAGAAIAEAAAEIFAASERIVTVKEPQRTEWLLLRSNQILFA